MAEAMFHTENREKSQGQGHIRAHSSMNGVDKMKDWKQLRIKHRKLRCVRIAYEEQRERLRREQEDMHAIDAQFIKTAGAIESVSIADMTNLKSEMLKDWETMQQARCAFAVEEAEYEKLEGRLCNLEGEVRDLESRIYRRMMTDSSETPEPEHEMLLTEDDLTESFISSCSVRRDISLEALNYYSQLGDVNILKAQLMDLKAYHFQAAREKVDRQEVGLEADEDLRLFLDSFDQRHDALCLQLTDAEKKLLEYENAPLTPEDDRSSPDELSLVHSLFGVDDYFAEDVDNGDLDARSVEDARLAATAKAFLFSPSDDFSVYRLLENQSDYQPIDKALYVNSWLIHRLRISTDDVDRLLAEHTNHGLRLEPDEFKRQVLAHWLQDGTIRACFALNYSDYSMSAVSGKAQKSRPASDIAFHLDQ